MNSRIRDPKKEARDWAVTLLVGSIVFGLYLTTLAPGVLGGDAGELQFVPSVLGITHPSGYPFQVLLDKLWVSVIPWGTVAWRTNLLSAVVAASAAAMVFAYVWQVTESLLLGMLALFTLSTTRVYWSQAVLADKYAMNGLFAVGLLVAAYRFWKKPRTGNMMVLTFLMGLSLTHHRALAVFVPPTAFLLVTRGWPLGKRLSTWLIMGISFLSPFMLYSYLFWARKNPPPHFISTFTLGTLRDYLLFLGLRGQVKWFPQVAGQMYFWKVLRENIFWPYLLGGGVGAIALWLRQPKRRSWLAYVWLGMILASYFAANYENFDMKRRYVYFLPSYVFVVVALTEGLRGWRYLFQKQPNVGRWVKNGLATVFLLLLLIALPHRWRVHWEEQRASRPMDIWRQTMKSGQLGDRMAASLALVKEPDALIVADWEQATTLWYAQLIEGYCPSCVIRQPMGHLKAYRKEFPTRPLYVARTLPGAVAWSYPTSVGPLVKLDRQPEFGIPDLSCPLNIQFDSSISLRGIRWPFGKPNHQPGSVISMELIWQRPEGKHPPRPYAISLRLVGPKGQVAQSDVMAPVLGMYPFDKLVEGQVIADFHEIGIPVDALSGLYHLHVTLYLSDARGFHNVEAVGPHGNRLGQTPSVLTMEVGEGRAPFVKCGQRETGSGDGGER